MPVTCSPPLLLQLCHEASPSSLLPPPSLLPLVRSLTLHFLFCLVTQWWLCEFNHHIFMRSPQMHFNSGGVVVKEITFFLSHSSFLRFLSLLALILAGSFPFDLYSSKGTNDTTEA